MYGISIRAAGVLAVVLAVPVAATAQTVTPPAASLVASRVDLGSAGNFTILSKTGITTTGVTKIVGHLGVSPIASTAITGFALKMSRQGTFSTSSLVTGRIYAANYATPTPAGLTTAIGDMQTAYNDAASRKNIRASELGSGNIGGKVIRQGVYKWSSGVTIPANVTLYGGPNAIWIFQIAGTLRAGAGKQVILSGGAQAKNVFWQVGGKTTLGTNSTFNGIILGKTAIVVMTGAKLNGKALSQTAVTLDANAISPNSASPVALELMDTPDF